MVMVIMGVIFLAGEGAVLVLVGWFLFVIFRWVGVFSPTPYLDYSFSSSSHRWYQMLLKQINYN